MRDKILGKLNKEDSKKVVMNFNIAKDLKSSFEESCKYDGVNMSSVLIAMIETYIEEVNESKYADVRADIKKIEFLNKQISSSNATEDDIDDLLLLKASFPEYIYELGEYIPSTNSHYVESLIDLGHYVLIIDTVLHFAKKEK